MKYIVEFMGGGQSSMNEEEFKNLAGKSGAIFIPSINQIINLNSVKRILPEEKYNLELRESRTKSIKGVLHTGERAIRYWGQWNLDNGSYLDDSKTGLPTKPEKILDPTYYPEVAKDCVPTPEEYYKNYEQLSDPQARLKAIMEVSGNYERLGNGFKRIGEVIGIKTKE